MDELPLVLLGIRSAWREGADASAAELVYGSALRLPGEFVPGSSRNVTPSDGFLRSLQDSMRTTVPPPVLFHSQPPTNTPPALAHASHVYV
ncbi:MAG: hypothetical protein WBN29_13905, partial [Polyangiales bacterium]